MTTKDERLSTKHQAASSHGRKIDALFITYDNGEGRAFRSMLQELDKRKVDWNLIALGPSEKLFVEKTSENRILYCSRAFSEEHKQWNENRDATMSVNVIDDLTGRYNPVITITGTVHKAQAQLADHFGQQGSYTIGFYDNMELPGVTQSSETWLNYKKSVNRILVTTSPLFDYFSKQTHRAEKVSLVQHPTLKEWQQTFDTTNSQLLRNDLKLSGQVALVAGGYGDGFPESLELIKSVANTTKDRLHWLFTPHPKFAEKTASEDHWPLKTVTHYQTSELATLANVFVTHKSSAGWLASQMGVPTIFVRPEAKKQDSNSGGLVSMVKDKEELLHTIDNLPLKRLPQSPHPINKTGTSLSVEDILVQQLEHLEHHKASGSGIVPHPEPVTDS